MRVLYNKNKWLEIYANPKYQEIRNKILTVFKDLIFVEDGHKYFLNGKEMECAVLSWILEQSGDVCGVTGRVRRRAEISLRRCLGVGS